MAAVETVREAVAQAVLPRLEKQLHVSHRNRDQPRRDAERLPLIAGDRGAVVDPEDAHGHAGDHRKAEDVPVDDAREAGVREGLRRHARDPPSPRAPPSDRLRVAVVSCRNVSQRSGRRASTQNSRSPANAGRYRHKACWSVGGSSAFASAWLKVISRSSSAERIRAWAASAAAATRLGLRLLPLAGFMEDEDAHENRQRRKQVDVIALLHVPRRLPDKAERPLKDHNGAGDEAHDERRVVSGDEAHDSLLA